MSAWMGVGQRTRFESGGGGGGGGPVPDSVREVPDNWCAPIALGSRLGLGVAACTSGRLAQQVRTIQLQGQDLHTSAGVGSTSHAELGVPD